MLTKDLPDELLPEKAWFFHSFITIAFSERPKTAVAIGIMGVHVSRKSCRKFLMKASVKMYFLEHV